MNLDENCIFCKILNNTIPSKKIYEDEDVIAFNDINPKMRVHFLIVPKKHIEMLSNCDINDSEHVRLLGKMTILAPVLAHQQGCNNGFKITIHNGKGGGQEVFHLHMHVMGTPI